MLVVDKCMVTLVRLVAEGTFRKGRFGVFGEKERY